VWECERARSDTLSLGRTGRDSAFGRQCDQPRRELSRPRNLPARPGRRGPLRRRGAQVVGFDHSPRMVELCRARVAGGEFRVHDLGDPIGWLPGSGMDLVLCTLAIEYVDDRVAALRELRRELRPGGALVLSRQHPTGDWLRHGGSYFATRVIEETWSKGWTVRYWLAPLETTCEEIFAAGFFIERLLEPRPVPEAAIDPGEYERLAREPRRFIAFRLRPRS
jgi:SAM-dependent methyltransferase